MTGQAKRPAAAAGTTARLPDWQPRREQVRQVDCPACSGRAGQPCQGRRGPRAAHHKLRVLAALEAMQE